MKHIIIKLCPGILIGLSSPCTSSDITQNHLYSGMEFQYNVVTYIKTIEVKDTIQNYVLDGNKVREYEHQLKTLLPQSDKFDEEVRFSPLVNMNKKVSLIEEGSLIGKAKKDQILYTWNLRECCAITLYNEDFAPGGILGHLYPASKSNLSNTIDSLLKECLRKHANDYRHPNTRATIVAQFLSEHLFNICSVLIEMGIPIKAIYYQPAVLERIGILKKTNGIREEFTMTYCSQRFALDGEKIKRISKETGEKVKRLFPRELAFDLTTGEISTMMKLRVAQ